MKREERKIYNSLKKTVTEDTLYVEIPTNWAHEARQAIHELLTVEKGMIATVIGPECCTFKETIRYTHSSEANKAIRQAQEVTDIDEVMRELRHTDYTWNGYKANDKREERTMYELLKALEKAGLHAESKLFSFGSYYDGQQHDFSYPCATVLVPGNLSGKETAALLEKLEKVEKKQGYRVYSKHFDPLDGFHLVLIRNDHIEEGRKGYSETIAFQTGFWMKHNENKNATDAELIKAGHAEMMKHGYSPRTAA